jgi:hypothetical protein
MSGSHYVQFHVILFQKRENVTTMAQVYVLCSVLCKHVIQFLKRRLLQPPGAHPQFFNGGGGGGGGGGRFILKIML